MSPLPPSKEVIILLAIMLQLIHAADFYSLYPGAQRCHSTVNTPQGSLFFYSTSVEALPREIDAFCGAHTHGLSLNNAATDCSNSLSAYHFSYCYPDIAIRSSGRIFSMTNASGYKEGFYLLLDETPNAELFRLRSTLVTAQTQTEAEFRSLFQSQILPLITAFASATSQSSVAACSHAYLLTMPPLALGLGTPSLAVSSPQQDSDLPTFQFAIDSHIKQALAFGIRHLDIAESFTSDHELGKALHQTFLSTSLVREDVWVTVRLDVNPASPASAALNMVESMHIDYIDLLIINIPPRFCSPSFSLQDAWSQAEALVRAGSVRYIGVANFAVRDLEELMWVASIKPYANQIEYHPYLQQRGVVNFCKENQINVMVYGYLSPLSGEAGPLDSLLHDVSSTLGVSDSAVLLRHAQQKGFCVVAAASSVERLQSYVPAIPILIPRHAGPFDGTVTYTFSLNEIQMQTIDSAGSHLFRRRYYTKQFTSSFQTPPMISARYHDLSDLDEWDHVEYRYGDSLPTKYPEPMKALVQGDVACVIVRELFSKDELAEILNRLDSGGIFSSDGRPGPVTMSMFPAQQNPAGSYFGQTLSAGADDLHKYAEMVGEQEEIYKSLFINTTNPIQRMMEMLNQMSAPSGKITGRTANMLKGVTGGSGSFRTCFHNGKHISNSFWPHIDLFERKKFQDPNFKRTYELQSEKYANSTIFSTMIVLQSPLHEGNNHRQSRLVNISLDEVLHNAGIGEKVPVNGISYYTGVFFDESVYAFARQMRAKAFFPRLQAGDAYIFAASKMHDTFEMVGDRAKVFINSVLLWDNESDQVYIIE